MQTTQCTSHAVHFMINVQGETSCVCGVSLLCRYIVKFPNMETNMETTTYVSLGSVVHVWCIG